MIHDLYTVFKLLDGQAPINFSAQTREHAQGGVDWAQAQIAWADNVIASFTANFHIPNGTVGGIDEISLYGDGWLVNLIYDSGVISVTTESGIRKIKVPSPNSEGATNHFDFALREEIQHFLKVIEGNLSVPLGARYEDACAMQKWLDNLISFTKSEGV
jgi:predicted dehydrogenase